MTQEIPVKFWRYCRLDNELVGKKNSRKDQLKAKHPNIRTAKWDDEMRRKHFRPPETEEEWNRLESSGGEGPLYKPVLSSITNLFSLKGECKMYLTAHLRSSGGLPHELLEKFDDISLHIIDNEGFYPDLMGFVTSPPSTSHDLIVADVKDDPILLRDILQVRNYGAVFDSRYAILISPEPVPENVKRWYTKRTSMGNYRYSETVRIAQWETSVVKEEFVKAVTGKHQNMASDLFETMGPGIAGATWLPSPPFPLKCKGDGSEMTWDSNKRKFHCYKCENYFEMVSV